jgi:arylsulfatase A-like enzyme
MKPNMAACIHQAGEACGGKPSVEIWIIALWFGLVTGLIEGLLFLLLQQLGYSQHVSIEIIWVSAFSNLFMFGVIGVVLIALNRFGPWRVHLWLAVFLFAFLALFDWLAVVLSDWIHCAALLILTIGLAVSFSRWFRNNEAVAVRFWRICLPSVVALAITAVFTIEGGLWLCERVAIGNLPNAPKNSPNILVLVVDALRADHLSAYGYARPTSPNIDRLAREGVLFEHAFATSPWTLPSHASLLTGRFPFEHGVGWREPRSLITRRDPTLGEALLARGYRTAAFSANSFWFTRERGFDRGFVHFEDYFHSWTDALSRTLYGRLFERFVLRRIGFEDIPARKRALGINDALLRWIDRDRTIPFFVFVNYMDTHDPYLPPQPYRSRFSRVKAPGGIINWRVGRSHPALTPEQLQNEIDAYDGAISYVDHAVGQLIEDLRRRDLMGNIVIVVTSDHGEAFGEHGVYLHANSLYLNEIRVPLVLWSPGRVPNGQRIRQPVTNAAVPATVMDVIGADDQGLFPRPSLAKLWKAPETQDWPYAIAEVEQISWQSKDSPSHHGKMKALVSRQWQYVEHERWGAELYDWRIDPNAMHNLARKDELQNVVAQFRSELGRLLRSTHRESAEFRWKETGENGHNERLSHRAAGLR